MLNQDPSVEVVRTIADSHRAFGTVGLLPTVITDDTAVTRTAIAAVRKARAKGWQMFWAFMSKVRSSMSHARARIDAKFIRPLDRCGLRHVRTTADCGCVMLTVAPNRVSPDDIENSWPRACWSALAIQMLLMRKCKRHWRQVQRPSRTCSMP